MNFFKLYIGDYQRDTAHLSIAEHGAFLLMMQHYYATEKALPVGKALHRMLRANDRAEKAAIDSVVNQFWVEVAGGLINERCDAEIKKAQDQADTNRRIAEEREARKRATKEAAEKARKDNEGSTNRATNRSTNDEPNHSQNHNHSQTLKEQQQQRGRELEPVDNSEKPVSTIDVAARFSMISNWQPEDLVDFHRRVEASGMAIPVFQWMDAIPEFVLYWQGRPEEKQNQFGWENKFLKSIQKVRRMREANIA